MPESEVYALDISREALEVARRNAYRHGVNVRFIEYDMLDLSSFPYGDFDLIVSNPPYVLESERSSMCSNVLDYEPAVALFVPDGDALRYYRAIVSASRSLLKAGGRLFFEINACCGDGVVLLLRESGLSEVSLMTDLSGRDRFVSALRTDK
jgi:release factor glutamine methyltransferase